MKRPKHVFRFPVTLAACLIGCTSRLKPEVARPTNKVPAPKIAALELVPKRSATYPNCFAGNKNSDPIRMIEYSYKKWYSTKLNADYALRAYVFYPQNFEKTHPLPTIAMFHGGGWIGGAPTYYFPLGQYLASRGVIAVTFQYRLQEVFDSTPEQSVNDGLSAIRWLQKYSRELGVDTKKIVTLGDSAGGTIALEAGLMEDHFDNGDGSDTDDRLDPVNIISLYPVVDTKLLDDDGKVPFALSHPTISPDLLLDKRRQLPQTLILHGTKDDDRWASFKKSKIFCQQANALAEKNVCEFSAYKGRKHAFLNTPADYKKAIIEIDRYLTQHNILPRSQQPAPQLIQHEIPQCRFTLKLYDKLRAQWGYESKISSRWNN